MWAGKGPHPTMKPNPTALDEATALLQDAQVSRPTSASRSLVSTTIDFRSER